MSTHYIPAFTHRDRWNQQQAVCGTWVDVKAHTNEPTCPECRAWVQQDAAEYEETVKALDAEFPADHDPRRS